MTKEQLGELILSKEESLYRVVKSLLYNDADCADAEIFIGDDVTKEEALKVVENLNVTATDKMKSPAEMGT